MPSPADKIVLAFQGLARLVQLTEWSEKEGQPGRARDPHRVHDEMSSSVALLLPPTPCNTGARARAHTRRHTKTASRRKQHKGRIKEFLICFHLLAVKEFVIHSARKTY